MAYPTRRRRARTQGQDEVQKIDGVTAAVLVSDAIRGRYLKRYKRAAGTAHLALLRDSYPSMMRGERTFSPRVYPASRHLVRLTRCTGERRRGGPPHRPESSTWSNRSQTDRESFPGRPLHFKKGARYWTTGVSLGDRTAGVESWMELSGVGWRHRPNMNGESARSGSLCDPGRLLVQRNGEQNPSHHVLRLEIFLRTIGMGIVAADARLGRRFICVNGLKDGGAALASHCRIGLIGIDENFRQAGPLEVGHRPIFGIDRPIADQPVLEPASPRRHKPPGF